MATNMLEGKTALVTGATGGMGKAIVEKLVEADVQVIAHGRSKERLEILKKEYPSITYEIADLNDVVQVENLAKRVIKNHGNIDILINNAGVAYQKNVIDLDLAEYESIMNINLRAVFILSKIIGEAMKKRGDGIIINIGSGASTSPIAGLAVYCASKYGLLGFSESLALELRSFGVKVSIVMPGSTATSFGDYDLKEKLLAKPGILMPIDVAEAVMFLLNQPRRAWTSQVNLRPLDINKQF